MGRGGRDKDPFKKNKSPAALLGGLGWAVKEEEEGTCLVLELCGV